MPEQDRAQQRQNFRAMPLIKKGLFLYAGLVGLAVINKDFRNVFYNNQPLQRLDPELPNSEIGYCIQSSERSSNMIDITSLKGEAGLSTLQIKDSKFESSVLHRFIASHLYKYVAEILDNFQEHRDLLLNDQDINGRTPLHIAMEVGAPANFISKLLTPKNVIMADNHGVTPLMLASRGEDIELTRQIIKLIGKDRIQQVVETTDAQGRSWEDWNKLPRDKLNEHFINIQVDGEKDAKSCTSSFFFANKRSQLYMPSFSETTKTAYEAAGLEVGTHFVENERHVGIKATKENAQKLLEISSSDSTSAVNGRNALGPVCSDVLSYWTSYGDYSKDAEFFRYSRNELPGIIDGFSGQSLVDLYISRQPKIYDLVQSALTVAKESSTPQENTAKHSQEPTWKEREYARKQGDRHREL